MRQLLTPEPPSRYTFGRRAGNGTVLERYDYRPYGSVAFWNPDYTDTWAETHVRNEFLFTGQMYDPETGLYHYKARALHPTIGRFLQRDPQKTNAQLSRYNYALSHPLVALDASGKDPVLLAVYILNSIRAAIIAGHYVYYCAQCLHRESEYAARVAAMWVDQKKRGGYIDYVGMDGKWHRVCFTKDPADLRFQLDLKDCLRRRNIYTMCREVCRNAAMSGFDVAFSILWNYGVLKSLYGTHP